MRQGWRISLFFSFVTSQVDLKKREESCMSDTDVVTYVVTSRHDYVRNVLWINKYEHAGVVMLLFINVVFLESEPLSCLEWLSEPRTTTERQQIVKTEYFTHEFSENSFRESRSLRTHSILPVFFDTLK